MDKRTYAKLLSPELTKAHLMAAGIYLTAYELLKSAIINPIKNFYIGGLFENNTSIKKRYETEVISLHKNIFEASCKWLLKIEAITPDDIQTMADIRILRNHIAHQLPDFLVDDDVNIQIDDLKKIQKILSKIDMWWIRNVELSANPDYSPIDYEEIQSWNVRSGPMLLVSYLISLLQSADASKQ